MGSAPLVPTSAAASSLEFAPSDQQLLGIVDALLRAPERPRVAQVFAVALGGAGLVASRFSASPQLVAALIAAGLVAYAVAFITERRAYPDALLALGVPRRDVDRVLAAYFAARRALVAWNGALVGADGKGPTSQEQLRRALADAVTATLTQDVRGLPARSHDGQPTG
jgi:hypothetical protein